MGVKKGDSLVEACVADKEAKYVFTVTENGMGKISLLDEYREQHRGGSGIKVANMTTKTGNIIGAFTLTDDQKKNAEIILISRDGQTIRIALSEVKVTSRTTQ